MPNFSQGIYSIKNPEKYIGQHAPKFRSSWEQVFMRFLDENPNITHWASEAIRIPYRHPFTGKQSIYVPDFFVIYLDKNGKRVAEVVEIKPKNQSLIESAGKSLRNKSIVVVNMAKWAAANAWCKRNGFIFRVVNEDKIFHQGNKQVKRK